VADWRGSTVGERLGLKVQEFGPQQGISDHPSARWTLRTAVTKCSLVRWHGTPKVALGVIVTSSLHKKTSNMRSTVGVWEFVAIVAASALLNSAHAAKCRSNKGIPVVLCAFDLASLEKARWRKSVSRGAHEHRR